MDKFKGENKSINCMISGIKYMTEKGCLENRRRTFFRGEYLCPKTCPYRKRPSKTNRDGKIYDRHTRNLKVIRLAKKGMTLDEIAEELGMKRATVYDVILRHGTVFVRDRQRKKRNKRIIEFHRQGKSEKEISKKLKLHITTIYNIIRNHDKNTGNRPGA